MNLSLTSALSLEWDVLLREIISPTNRHLQKDELNLGHPGDSYLSVLI